MAADVTTRKLATIVALDIAGYSARAEADEARTTAEVAALRTVIEAIAAKPGGRIFNTAGDGFMLEFGSSLAAVEAALALAETCEPRVRVGVHLGDVMVQPNGDLLMTNDDRSGKQIPGAGTARSAHPPLRDGRVPHSGSTAITKAMRSSDSLDQANCCASRSTCSGAPISW